MTSKFLEDLFGDLNARANDPFLIHPPTGVSLSFGETYRRADRLSKIIPSGLSLLAVKDRLAFALTYVSALRSQNPVLVIDPDISDDALSKIADEFKPSSIVSDERLIFSSWEKVQPYGIPVYKNPVAYGGDIYPELASLMPTSGSTGSPKCVRVSYANVLASAKAISGYLEVEPSRVLITSLPLHYTYGLSLLHVAIWSGVPLVLSEHSTLTSEFWRDFLEYRATDFSGVPFQYEMLMRSGLPERVMEQMICMTQAGGKLPVEKTRFFLEKAAEHGIKFFTMYGQTEATPRIAYVPPSSAMSKLGSAGKPIPGGTIAINKASKLDAFGEVIFSGPNVCLGYAFSAEDLSLPDQFCGVLQTGDIGYLDEDGFLFLTGRASRDIKVSGKRVNLDQLEQGLSVLTGESVVLGVDETIVIVSVQMDQSTIWDYVRKQTTLHPSKISLVTVQELPRLSSGKVNYQQLRSVYLRQ